MRPRAVTLIALASITWMPLAQSAPQRLDFEVVSIHPSKPEQIGGGISLNPDGTGYKASVMTVKLLISAIYRIPVSQIQNAPDWTGNDMYSIEAKADKQYPLDELQTMFRNMLADRFKLRFHIERKEGNAYLLTIDKGGLKMKPNDSPQDYHNPITSRGQAVFKGVRAPVSDLCLKLGQILGGDERPVIDQTGLKGNYDFTLTYFPQNISDQDRASLPQELLDRPSLYDAVREQLGLKLTAGKGPIDHMIIEHIERPTEN